MKHPALTARFLNVNEIRMGSPFNHAHVEIVGGTPSFLRDREYQDLALSSADGNDLILVEWDIVKNSPGFRLIRLQRDPRTGALNATRTERFIGAVVALASSGDSDGTRVTVFRHPEKLTEVVPPSSFSENLI